MTYLFINSENEYPRHPGDILLVNPDFDGTNLPDGWIAVTPMDPPTIGENQVADEIFPQLIDGQYVQSWLVRNLTQEEIDARNNSRPEIVRPIIN